VEAALRELEQFAGTRVHTGENITDRNAGNKPAKTAYQNNRLQMMAAIHHLITQDNRRQILLCQPRAIVHNRSRTRPRQEIDQFEVRGLCRQRDRE
jgi:hypothetical protein